jgi:hypothetical protein
MNDASDLPKIALTLTTNSVGEAPLLGFVRWIVPFPTSAVEPAERERECQDEPKSTR